MDSPPRFSAADVLDQLPSGEAGTPPQSRSAAPCPLPEASPAARPQLSAGDLLEQLRGQFEKLCEGVAGAVNGAPPGQIINASEEKVRDILADFRLATYQAAIQLRLEAAQAAFPPSTAPDDGQTPAEQGP